MTPVVYALLMSESIFSLGSGLFLPMFAIFSERIGGDLSDAGIAAAIFLFVTSSLEYPVGKLLDKYHGKWFLVFDYTLEGLVFIGYMFVTNKYELFILQIILGIASAVGDPAWESLYGKEIPEKKAGSFWAKSHLFIGYATTIGILVGAWAGDNYGFNVLFAFGAAFSFIGALVAVFGIKHQSIWKKVEEKIEAAI